LGRGRYQVGEKLTDEARAHFNQQLAEYTAGLRRPAESTGLPKIVQVTTDAAMFDEE
jgi:hypothetical protein